eukprot:g13850.t1
MADAATAPATVGVPPSTAGDYLRESIGVACVIFPVLVFLSPISAYFPAYVHRRRMKLPPLPVTALTAQCFLWLLYGIGLKALVMIVPNVIGLVLGFVYIGLYQRFLLFRGGGLPLCWDDRQQQQAPPPPREEAGPQQEAAAAAVTTATTADHVGAEAGPPQTSAGDHVDVRSASLHTSEADALSEADAALNASMATRRQYARREEAADIRKRLFEFRVQALVVAVMGLTSCLLFGLQYYEAVGIMAMLLGILMLISPVFEVAEALGTGNPEVMGTVIMNVIMLLNCVVWTIQGAAYLRRTPVVVQNSFGIAGNVVALAARSYMFYFPRERPDPVEADLLTPRTEERGMVMGGDTAGAEVAGKKEDEKDGLARLPLTRTAKGKRNYDTLSTRASGGYSQFSGRDGAGATSSEEEDERIPFSGNT